MKIAKTCLLLIILTTVFLNPIAIAEERTVIQEKKLQQITELQKKLKAKRGKYIKTISEFYAEIKMAKDSISKHIANRNANSYEEVNNDTVVINSLEVIQKAEAYSAFFKEEVAIIKESEIEMDKLASLARIKLIALSGLEDTDEFDRLLAQIDLVIEDIQPHANESVFEKDLLKTKSLKDIWNKHFSGKRASKKAKSTSKRKNRATKVIAPSFSYKHDLGKTVTKSVWNASETHLASFGDNKVIIWDQNASENLPIVPEDFIHFLDIQWQSQDVIAIFYMDLNWDGDGDWKKLVYLDSSCGHSDKVGVQLYNIKTGKIIGDINLGQFCSLQSLTFFSINKKYIIYKSDENGLSIVEIDPKGTIIRTVFSSSAKTTIINTGLELGKIFAVKIKHYFLLAETFTNNFFSSTKTILICKNDDLADIKTIWKKNDQIIDDCPTGFAIQEADWNYKYKFWAIYATSSKLHHVIIWDTKKEKVHKEYTYSRELVQAIKYLSWSIDEEYLVYVTNKDKSNVINFKGIVKTNFELAYRECNEFFWHPGFFWSSDENVLAINCTHHIKLVEIPNRREFMLIIPKNESITSANWSPTGKYLSVSTNIGKIHVWKDLVKMKK